MQDLHYSTNWVILNIIMYKLADRISRTSWPEGTEDDVKFTKYVVHTLCSRGGMPRSNFLYNKMAPLGATKTIKVNDLTVL